LTVSVFPVNVWLWEASVPVNVWLWDAEVPVNVLVTVPSGVKDFSLIVPVGVCVIWWVCPLSDFLPIALLTVVKISSFSVIASANSPIVFNNSGAPFTKAVISWSVYAFASVNFAVASVFVS
jgi:hypothetical protein